MLLAKIRRLIYGPSGARKRDRFQVVSGDLTQQRVDVIVNAANQWLTSGHGVSAAIHMVAGPELATECARIEEIHVGDVAVTKAYGLPATAVVHAVTPFWNAQHARIATALLSACYCKCLDAAAANGARSIAFPVLGAGGHQFPFALALKVASTAVVGWVDAYPDVFDEILFVCPERDAAEQFRASLLDALRHRNTFTSDRIR